MQKTSSFMRQPAFSLPDYPPYIIPEILTEETFLPDNDLLVVYKLRNNALSDIYTYALTYQSDQQSVLFEQLARQIQEDCPFTQSRTRLLSHPAYKSIVGMGKDIIPLLLNKLNENPTFWFLALNMISGANPISENHRGNINKMVSDWKKWARKNGYTAK